MSRGMVFERLLTDHSLILSQFEKWEVEKQESCCLQVDILSIDWRVTHLHLIFKRPRLFCSPSPFWHRCLIIYRVLAVEQPFFGLYRLILFRKPSERFTTSSSVIIYSNDLYFIILSSSIESVLIPVKEQRACFPTSCLFLQHSDRNILILCNYSNNHYSKTSLRLSELATPSFYLFPIF